MMLRLATRNAGAGTGETPEEIFIGEGMVEAIVTEQGEVATEDDGATGGGDKAERKDGGGKKNIGG